MLKHSEGHVLVLVEGKSFSHLNSLVETVCPMVFIFDRPLHKSLRESVTENDATIKVSFSKTKVNTNLCVFDFKNEIIRNAVKLARTRFYAFLSRSNL